MRMKRKLNTLFSLSKEVKGLFVLSMVFSFYSYVVNEYFRTKVNYGFPTKGLKNKSTTIDRNYLQSVATALKLTNKYMPFTIKCRHEALTATLLLKRKKIPYQVYVGFRPDENGKIMGHVWTMAGDCFVTGHCKKEEYIIQEVYVG